jgi:hypothetical protein
MGAAVGQHCLAEEGPPYYTPNAKTTAIILPALPLQHPHPNIIQARPTIAPSLQTRVSQTLGAPGGVVRIRVHMYYPTSSLLCCWWCRVPGVLVLQRQLMTLALVTTRGQGYTLLFGWVQACVINWRLSTEDIGLTTRPDTE